jgi:predicted acylesterase/phospholipase RssA
MVDTQRTLSKDPHRIRILSLDGGGIYGLIGAIWLRRLCEGNPRFLDGQDVDVFAGCSSGAINALLLARHERPREAVLAGELERFWTSPAPFSNSRRLGHLLSLAGLRGWFSDTDLLGALREVFGDLELGELAHHVHISTFNWTGSGKLKKSRAGQASERHWKPKFFGNMFADDEDFDDPVAEIAYAAATPPMFRPMRNGLGDGASFNGNPSVSVLAQVVRAFHVESDDVIHVRRSKLKLSDATSAAQVGAVLGRVSLVSMGSGQRLPYYAFGDIDLGSQFVNLPSNPFTGVIWPPAAYALDAATEEAEFITKQLLGRRRAIRVNPPTVNVPTIMASLWARNPVLRDLILRQIYWATDSPETREALGAALEFLASPDGWNRG